MDGTSKPESIQLDASYVSIRDVESAHDGRGKSGDADVSTPSTWSSLVGALTKYLTEEVAVTSEEQEEEDKCKVPDLSYLQLFAKFLSFGCRAFGGPVAQVG